MMEQLLTAAASPRDLPRLCWERFEGSLEACLDCDLMDLHFGFGGRVRNWLRGLDLGWTDQELDDGWLRLGLAALEYRLGVRP